MFSWKLGTGKITTTLRLNIRSGPNTESEIVGIVGEKLQAPRDTMVFAKFYLNKIKLKLTNSNK